MHRIQRLAGAAALALGLGATHAAEAAVVQVLAPQQLSAVPITFSFGTASFSFTLDNSGSFPMSSIASSPTGLVTTIFGSVADFGTDAPIDGTGNGGYSFAAYPTPTSIQYSAALDFVGFSFMGAGGGTQYGYAEVFGSTFVGYAYETSANTTIFTQEVPEPASAVLLVGGLAMVGMARRKKRTSRRELLA